MLAAREALAAEPGADAAVKVDVGRSLTAVAMLLEATGKTDEALAAYRRSESLLAGLAASDPAAPGRAGGLPDAAGLPPVQYGKTADALAAYRLARADQEALAAAPGASNDARRDLADTIKRIGIAAVADGQAGGGGGRVSARALAIRQEAGRRQSRRHRFRSDLAASHFGLGILLH